MQGIAAAKNSAFNEPYFYNCVCISNLGIATIQLPEFERIFPMMHKPFGESNLANFQTYNEDS